MGPSMAEGSQGCKLNWADFPVAARIRPNSGRVFDRCREKICWKSQVFRFVQNHNIDRTNPISPMRLYRIAWRAAVLASARPYHQLINIKDMMPTPSQPINS